MLLINIAMKERRELIEIDSIYFVTNGTQRPSMVTNGQDQLSTFIWLLVDRKQRSTLLNAGFETRIVSSMTTGTMAN